MFIYLLVSPYYNTQNYNKGNIHDYRQGDRNSVSQLLRACLFAMSNLLIFSRKTNTGCTAGNAVVVHSSRYWHGVCLYLTYMVVCLRISFYNDISSHAYTCSDWITTGKNSFSTLCIAHQLIFPLFTCMKSGDRGF